MADGVIPDVGETLLAEILQDYFNNTDTPFLRLYQNDYTPDADTDLGDLTEATFPGYTTAGLNNWADPVADDDGNAMLVELQHLFTMSGSSPTNTIYGYYIVKIEISPPDRLIAVVRFDEPVAMDATGKQLTVLPVLKLKDCVEAVSAGTGSGI